MGDGGVAFLDRGGQVGQGILKRGLAVHLVKRVSAAFHPRVLQQVADQQLHPLGTLHDVTDQRLGPFIELVAVSFFQDLDATGDGPQRFLEIMRCDVGEDLEFPVGMLESGRSMAQLFLRLFALADVVHKRVEPVGGPNPQRPDRCLGVKHMTVPAQQGHLGAFIDDLAFAALEKLRHHLAITIPVLLREDRVEQRAADDLFVRPAKDRLGLPVPVHHQAL